MPEGRGGSKPAPSPEPPLAGSLTAVAKRGSPLRSENEETWTVGSFVARAPLIHQGDPLHPSAPLPDRRTLQRVCEWLDTRRLVTTELYVIPPRYVKVAVALGIVIKPGYPIEGVRRWAELIVRQYLAPVPPYGPEGRGWPLGRRVVAGELEAAVAQVEGVEYVRNLRLAGWDAKTEAWVEVVADREADPPIEATIQLALDEVVELAEITVLDGPALKPGEQIATPPLAKTPVPIPIERQEC